MKTKTIIIALIGMLSVAALIFQSCNKEEEKSNQSPSCKITAPVNGQEIVKGETIMISVQASDSDGSIAEVKFMVDGAELSKANSDPYTYSWVTTNESIGNHSIKATSTDNEGASTSNDISVVLIQGGADVPVANFTSNITSGLAPLTVSFTDQSTNNPISWEWDFGTGTTSDQQNHTHVYNSEGAYTVTLTVTNENGSDTETKVDYIVVSASAGNGDPCPGTPTVTDADGNVYNTVQIGEQCWMRENLNVGTRIDGSQEMTDNSTTEKYCYNDDPANCEIYGGLYQWNEMMQYTATQSVQGICPIGWHLPSDDEWISLSEFLGGAGISGGKMKETGTEHWASPNEGATNESGFSALPGGQRHASNLFSYIGGYGKFYSSTFDNTYHWSNQLVYNEAVWRRVYGAPDYAFSVRCLKD